MKEEIILFCTVVLAMIGVGVSSFQFGKDNIQREAVVAGHALWTYDKYGNPKFHWKDQETFIRQSK